MSHLIRNTYLKLYDTRKDLIDSLVPKYGNYAEIGVLNGDFSRELFNILSPKKLVLIDLFEGSCYSGDKDGNNVMLYDLNASYQKQKEWEADNTSIRVLKGDSSTILKTFDNNFFDMIYLDGDHSYEGCKKDLLVAYDKVKNNGFIIGHDYEMNFNKTKNSYHFGVKRAVDEFCLLYNQKIIAKANDGCVSFAIQIRK